MIQIEMMVRASQNLVMLMQITSQDPYSIPSMINHCVLSPEPPPEEEEKLVSKEEFLQLWAEHREQMRKDWAEILLKINNLNI